MRAGDISSRPTYNGQVCSDYIIKITDDEENIKSATYQYSAIDMEKVCKHYFDKL